MEPTLTSRSRPRWLFGLAIAACVVTGAGAAVSATAPPDTTTTTTTTAPAATTTTPAPPVCAAAATPSGSTPADSTSAGSAEAETTVAATTAAPTTLAETTTAAPTTAPPSAAATTAAPPSIDLPLPDVSPPADGSAPTPPAGSLSPDQQIVLRRDGVGLGRFCDDADTVIAAVTGVLGEPSDDTGWADPLAVSNCAGTEVRRVTWGSLDLYFGDASRFADGVRHFFGYVYGNRDSLEVTPQGLSTPEGIGIGSTVDYLLANYPDAQVFPGEEGIADPLFYVDENLGGFLTDSAADGVVTVLFGGEDCGV